MQTSKQQREFFDSHWPGMKSAVETGGAKAVVEFINGFSDDLERRVLYVFARQGLIMKEWRNRSLDPYVEVSEAGVAEMLRQADAAKDEKIRAARRNAAHMVSFNLAADLADCWPNDEDPRTEEHFERGLKAAEDCIGWCDPGNPDRLARDWWIKGMHQMSLGRTDEAGESWERSLGFVREAAKAAGRPEEVSSDADFALIVGSGFVGLSRWIAGDEEGRALYDRVIHLFTEHLADEDRHVDAEFGIDQLEKVRRKYGPKR